MDAKLASVIVLNYNAELVIARCLDHLLAQTYPNFEILVVDNNSTDGSPAILEKYARRGVRIIRSAKNLGVPGGRNLGLQHARGEIVAFIDDDGFAKEDWLAQAVRALESDEQVGAVAPAVFFASHKLILNGCGGTMNYQGYGGDFCYHAPYEFARIPNLVLYPMGCGMVIRRSALDAMGHFDAVPIKWYEDVELGIWLWGTGYKVIAAPDAWVDHGWGHSDAFLPAKVYMCERARIRTVLKYYPASRLILWLYHEGYSFVFAPARWLRLKAWMWNLMHLGSALKWRYRSRKTRKSYWHLLYPSWGTYPPPVAYNGSFQPDPSHWRPNLEFDGESERAQLNFGWHPFERSTDNIPFRWTEEHASAFFHLSRPAAACSLKAFTRPEGYKGRIVIRRVGNVDALSSFSLVRETAGWSEIVFDCALEPGSYELQINSLSPFQDRLGRTLGAAISHIGFQEEAAA